MIDRSAETDDAVPPAPSGKPEEAASRAPTESVDHGPPAATRTPPPFTPDPSLTLWDQPIFVLGPPRSGTSLITGCLHACGLWLGQTVGGGAENPRGFFENYRIREGITKALLRRLGADPLGVRPPLPALDGLPRVGKLRQNVHAVLRMEGYRGDRQWGYKGAKLTLLWPIWARHFPRARWLIVRRRDEAIVRSCLKTSFMRQHSDDPAFWADFVAGYRQRLEVLKNSRLTWHEISPEPLIAGDLSPLEALIEAWGLAWRPQAVRALVMPEVYGQHETPS